MPFTVSGSPPVLVTLPPPDAVVVVMVLMCVVVTVGRARSVLKESSLPYPVPARLVAYERTK